MTDGYQGQPEYVVVGYLSDLFEPWKDIEGSEWGDFMTALHDLIEACITVSDEERAAVLVGWFREEMQRAFDEDWWGLADDEYIENGIWNAQDEYERITADWRERAVGFKGTDALEATIADLPAWVRPDPNRPARPDPEREQYERLRAKFERGPTDG